MLGLTHAGVDGIGPGIIYIIRGLAGSILVVPLGGDGGPVIGTLAKVRVELQIASLADGRVVEVQVYGLHIGDEQAVRDLALAFVGDKNPVVSGLGDVDKAVGGTGVPAIRGGPRDRG